MHINNYSPTIANVWSGREDSPPNTRFFQKVTTIDFNAAKLPDNFDKVIVGFCSDAGIKRNLGQVGARLGPDVLRQYFGKLASHTNANFIDIGNVACVNNNLEDAQDNFSKVIKECHLQNHRTIAFGGGHEIALGHFLGLAENYPRLGIINFDAHFDTRALFANGQGSSGTPFRQIKNYCDVHNRDFHYCCLGIQRTANTRDLFEYANENNIKYLTANTISTESIAWQKVFLDDFIIKVDAIYLTICLDVFAETFAPGVSAPQALGLNPWRTLPLLKYIMQTGKVVSIDFAELSPPLDENNKTARLAGLLLAEMLNSADEAF